MIITLLFFYSWAVSDLFYRLVSAAGQDAEVENGAVDAPEYQRAMSHPRRDEYHRALGDDELFIFQPELYFRAQVIGFLIIAAEKADNLTLVMFV
jgi:hypothetical protein